MIDLDEAVGKYRAACDIRDELEPDFVIMARTDSRGAVGGSLDEVVRRGKAYLEAGVDVFYAEALQSRDEIRHVRAAVPDCPMLVTIKPPLSAQEVMDLGLCTSFLHIARVGAIAMYDLLSEYAVRGSGVWQEFLRKTEKHPLGGFGLFDLAGFPQLQELERKYLPKEKLDRYDSSLGMYDPRVGDKERLKPSDP